jgi:UDPglucose 6-dehydrogenase
MIGIIGQGFVGNAIYQKFKEYFVVNTYDLDPQKRNTDSLKKVVDKSEFIFVCLPTPMKSIDGSCDISIVENVIEEINSIDKHVIVVIKSTIPPGTTEKLNRKYENINIVFNPEFLTEVNAVQDFNDQKRIVLGGPRPSTTKLRRIYTKVFPKAHIIKTDSTHAEMVKYLTNSFLATKVSFANEIYQICDKLNLDYDKVVEYSTLDERLGQSHWSVPGPDGDLGYGGHCFPKDVRALIHLAEKMSINPLMLKSTNKKNDQVRKNRDWEKMKGRAIS